MKTFQYDVLPATATTVQFTMQVLAATNSDRLYASTAPALTEVYVHWNGVYQNTINTWAGSAISRSQYVFTLSIPAAAIPGTNDFGSGAVPVEVIDIVIGNYSGARDVHLQLRTVQKLGQINVNATGFGGNTDALKLTAVGTGKAINAAGDIYTSGAIQTAGALTIGGALTVGAAFTVAGGVAITGALAVSTNITAAAMTISGALTAATIAGVPTSLVLKSGTLGTQAGITTSQLALESGSGTDDFYNTAIVLITSGTGAGQSRVITDYDATGGTLERLLTVNRAWAAGAVPVSGDTYVILPGEDVWSFGPSAELSDIPAVTAGYGDKIQALWQRFFYKRTQSASTFTMYKANSSAALGVASVDDDGTLQTSGKITTAP